jgi:hypothetical protein
MGVHLGGPENQQEMAAKRFDCERVCSLAADDEQ